MFILFFNIYFYIKNNLNCESTFKPVFSLLRDITNTEPSDKKYTTIVCTSFFFFDAFCRHPELPACQPGSGLKWLNQGVHTLSNTLLLHGRYLNTYSLIIISIKFKKKSCYLSVLSQSSTNSGSLELANCWSASMRLPQHIRQLED